MTLLQQRLRALPAARLAGMRRGIEKESLRAQPSGTLALTPPDAMLFHAGTALRDGEVVSAGGRVLCVAALGDSVKLAQQRVYQLLHGVRFEGAQYRRDIGHRAIKR